MHSDRRQPLPAEEREIGAVGARDALSTAGFNEAWFGGAYLATLFLPPFVLVAAAAAFREEHRRGLAILLVGFGLFGILAAMEGLPGPWLRALPPFDRVRYPAKFLGWTCFSVAMLAGLGLDTLRFAAGGRKGRAAFGLAGLAALALAALAPLPFPVRLASAVGSAALGFLALGAGGRPVWGALSAGVASAALVAALAIGLGGIPRFAPEAALRHCPASLEPLSRIAGRVLTPPMAALVPWTLRDGSFDAATLARQREALLGYTNLTCGVTTVRTAAPLKTAGAHAIERSIGAAEDAMPAGAASARALWTPFPPARLPSRKIGEFFRAPLAPYRPRLSFVRGYRVEPDSAAAWGRVAAGKVDVTREVLLDRRPDPDPAGAGERPLLVAGLVEDRPERVVADVTSSFPGLLVLTDLHAPGWIAEVAGRRLPILRADGYFRAVSLPAGTHRVVFRYRPVAFYAGAAVSGLALLVLVFLWHQGEPIPLGRRRA